VTVSSVAVRTGLIAVAFVLAQGLVGRAATLSPGSGEGMAFCSTVTPSGHPLGANYDNVWACGPAPGSGSPGYGDAFEARPYGFQCTELANRFLWDRWGLSPIFGATLDGVSFAKMVHDDHPSVALVTNGTAGQPYLPGDIVSFTGGADGHVAVVIASTEDSNGNGDVTIMEENAASKLAPNGQETLSVAHWMLQKPAGSYVTPVNFDALAPVKSAPPPSRSDFLIVRGNWHSGFQVGPYIVPASHDRPTDPDLTLSAAERALGKPTCEVTKGNTYAATWETWNLDGQHLLGVYTPVHPLSRKPYDAACSISPSEMYINELYVGTYLAGRPFPGSMWHTDRGLRLGDTLARLRALYPDARNVGHNIEPNWDVGTLIDGAAPLGFDVGAGVVDEIVLYV